MEYRKVFLTPGQQMPAGNTGVTSSDGGIIWVGEDNSFPATAILGVRTSLDPEFETSYVSEVITEAEYIEASTHEQTELEVLQAKIAELEALLGFEL